MAEKKTITLEVVVDDKGSASVKILTNEIKKLNDVQKTSTKQTKEATANNAALAQQITKLANSKRRTIEVIQQEIKLRKQLISQTVSTNDGYLRGTLQIQRLERELRMLTKTQSAYNSKARMTANNMGSVRSATGNATGMMVELGRTISDANYGITGMANNLQQLASTFILTTRGSGGFKGALKDLGKSFMGVGGILVIVSTAITLFERYSMKQKQAKEDTDNLTKSIDEQIKKFDALRGKFVEDVNIKTFGGIRTIKIPVELGVDLAGKQLEDFVKVARREFKDFDEMFKTLGGKPTENQIRVLIDDFNELQELRKKQASLEAELNEKGANRVEIGKQITANVLQQIEIEEKYKKATEETAKAREQISPVSAIVPFDKKFASEQLDMLAEHFGIEVGMVEERELELKRINERSLKDELKLAKSRAFIEEKKRQDRLATLGALADATNAASELFAEGTAENKAFGIASATIDTYIGANQVWKDATLPTVAKIPAVAAIILSGIANVKKIMAVNVPNRGSGGGGAATPVIEAPDFNIVGASPTNQLAQTIATAEQQPLRAFVVSDDVTTAQQLDRNIIEGASLG